MRKECKIYKTLENRFENLEEPRWHEEVTLWLRGGAEVDFGMYLYNLIKERGVNIVLNIGTARGYSAICCSKGVSEKGEVFTVDIRDPRKERRWHTQKHKDEDPLKGRGESMENLINKFSEGNVNILTGDSNSITEKETLPDFDLVFHDGEHSYEKVYTDLENILSNQESIPINVFDDCHPFTKRKLLGAGFKKGDLDLFSSEVFFPGVRKAVLEGFRVFPFSEMECVGSVRHSPITTLF